MTTYIQRTAAFQRLHQAGCFVIPNPWDLGSARALAQLGFPALATTSSGFAWSVGRSDNDGLLEDALTHFEELAEGVDVPVSADFQDCFAADPSGVEKNVVAAAPAGRKRSPGSGVGRPDGTAGQDSPGTHFLAPADSRMKS